MRVQCKDNAEELKLAEKDAEYSLEVTNKVYPLLDQLDPYHKCLAKRDTKINVEEEKSRLRAFL